MAAASCSNEFYGFCPVGAGYRGDVRDRGCTTFRVYRCVYTQRHTRTVRNPWRIILSVIVLGLLSNVVGDAGYIILLPIAATLFHSVGLHPIGGS